ncbi:MAG: hypothetical protein EB092_05610, partial [Chitinophagia bacterium]|nr:hypothetical protein [Chitinophagia bacterium]
MWITYGIISRFIATLQHHFYTKITMGAISLIALLIAAIAFSAGGILIGKILVKGSKNPQKG